MAKKYYAVKKGIAPGIYGSWEECKRNVLGFSGAEYKSFGSRQEAEAFLKGSAAVKGAVEAGTTASGAGYEKEKGIAGADSHRAVAYVDGSYHAVTGEYSYGAVIFYHGREEHFSRKFAKDENASMRNVAGEIEGSMCAMRYCMERGIGGLDIYYDYEGIEKWCTGAWKATKAGTIAYQEFYRKAASQVDIRFVKVKGHSGDTYNDLADRLAKEAVGNL